MVQNIRYCWCHTADDACCHTQNTLSLAKSGAIVIMQNFPEDARPELLKKEEKN